MEVHSYMANLFSQFGQGEVWFSVSIEKHTGKVISANLGKTQGERPDIGRSKEHS
jgi:hypothetical protein